MEQIVQTGDPATDKEVMEEMRRSYEAAGMSVQVTPLPPGGYRLQIGTPQVAAVATPGGQAVAMPPTGACEIGGEEGAKLVGSARQGNIQDTMNFLAGARKAGDWDDYIFMIGHVGPELPRDLLDRDVAKAPQNPDLKLLRAAGGIKSAWDARGTGTADTITEEGAEAMVNLLETSRKDLIDAARLDPANPSPYAMMIEVSTLHEEMSRQDGQAAFQQAVQRHPANMQAFRNALRLSAQKWGGSHDEQLKVARFGLSLATPGSDLNGCVFYAHIEIWFYMRNFEGAEDSAQAYITSPAVQAELNQAFDRWVTPQYKARRVSPHMLHLAAFWYYLVRDKPRLKRAMGAINQVQVAHPWHYLGEPTMMYMEALRMAM